MERTRVYQAIDTEREYQHNLARNIIKRQTPMEHLAIISKICRDMEEDWYNNPGQPPMSHMRKIAAVAVRCMEEHGVEASIDRSTFEDTLLDFLLPGLNKKEK